MSVNEILSNKGGQVNNKTSKYCNNCKAKDINELNTKGITDNYRRKTKDPSQFNSMEKGKMHYLKITLVLSIILSYLVNSIIFNNIIVAIINTIISIMYSFPIFFYSSHYEPPFALGNGN